jgi:hypothetical protein
VGLFPRANGLGRAERAAAGLQGRVPAPICATPVNAAYGSVLAVATASHETTAHATDTTVRHNHELTP